MSDPEVDKAVRHTVGIAALRRLHRMIAAEQMRERSEARWAARLTWAFLAAAAAAVAWLAFR